MSLDFSNPIKTYNEKRERFEWKVGDIYHREDGPAIEYLNGSFEWRNANVIHRIGGPAMAWVKGNKKYMSDQLTENADGKLVKMSDDEKYVVMDRAGYACMVNGVYHCENGPAIYFEDGEQHYCIRGKYHREDGPAIIKKNKYGNKESIKYAYYINDELHREDGPALIYHNDKTEWWKNGKKIG